MLIPKMFKNQNFENLSPMPTRHYEPFMLDDGSMKSEYTSILLLECNQDTFLGDTKWALELALTLSCCKLMKTTRPAVEKLHCCITEVNLIQCVANSHYLDQTDFCFELESLCSRVNTYFGGGGYRCNWLLSKHPTIQFEI